jgi:hypothetical protein
MQPGCMGEQAQSTGQPGLHGEQLFCNTAFLRKHQGLPKLTGGVRTMPSKSRGYA